MYIRETYQIDLYGRELDIGQTSNHIQKQTYLFMGIPLSHLQTKNPRLNLNLEIPKTRGTTLDDFVEN